MYTFSIPCKALSFNNCYPTNRMGRRYLTTEGSVFKKTVFNYVKEQCSKFKLPLDHVLIVEYYFYSNTAITKKGLPSKTSGDVDGKIKLTQDAMCEALNIDDSIIFEITAKKIFSAKNSITVIVRTLPMTEYNTIN